MSFEIVEFDGVRYAEVIWADTRVEITKFYSPPESSLQFGLLAHPAGFIEAPHYHHPAQRVITDMLQMLVVQRGKLGISFYDQTGHLLKEIVLGPGDAINLVHGAHSVRAIEDMQCVSVKQGPFLGAAMDKVEIEARP